MSRQDANAAFALTSFLYGGNAAYIEDLYARYESRPELGRCRVADFFGSLKDDAPTSRKSARGAVLEAADWPIAAATSCSPRSTATGPRPRRRSATRSRPRRRRTGVEISPADVQQATRDSIRALMLIRAYRIRGHFHANLDPLGLEPRKDDEELDPRSYGFTEADFDRKIFLDNVLGLEFAHAARDRRDPAAHLLPDARRRVHAHLRRRARRRWIQERIEGPDKEITFTREGKRAILNKLVEAEGFEKFCDVKFTGTKRFGLDGGESLIPALEQIIKRGGASRREGDRARHGRIAAASTCSPQVMGKPHRALFHEFKGGSADARRRRRLGRREVSPRRLVGPRVRRQQGASVAHREPVASRDRQSGGARQGARQAGPARRDAAKTAPW